MPSDDSKVLLELRGKMENLSKEIKKHNTEPEYPPNISAALIDSQIAKLND